jgi:hypothetical protein
MFAAGARGLRKTGEAPSNVLCQLVKAFEERPIFGRRTLGANMGHPSRGWGW